MAGEQWYYVQAGQRLGPVPVETLRSLLSAGAVGVTDLVWSEGMADWMAAATVPGLAPAARTPAPAAQPQYNAPPQYPAGEPYAQAQPYSQPQPYGQPRYGVPAHSPGYGQPVNYYAPPVQGGGSFAGFWLRFIAMLIDSVILGFILGLVIFMLVTVTGVSLVSSRGNYAFEQLGAALLLIYGSAVVVPWLYYAFMESSASQGTPGKRAMGLRVTDGRGSRISFGKATGRYFGRILSSFFAIGYIMAAFTERKQALHDILADCLIIQG